MEIWFEFASPYSYLTVMRADDLLKPAGIAFEWRPFLLGPIFAQKGWPTSPFVLDPTKGRHMWRDVERRAARHNLPFRRAEVFPMRSLDAARIMTAALDEPWAGAFAKAVFAAAFGRGEDIADEPVLACALEQAGGDPRVWLERRNDPAVKEMLRTRTGLATELGIFGAPSFRLGDELFWGDDRLEDAIEWASRFAGQPAA